MDGARRAAHALQVILSRYQLLEEGCVDGVSKLLRQAVVFEASCLANEQYEARTTFKAAESVSKERDLETFVAAQLLQHETKDAGADNTGVQGAGAALFAVVSRSLGLPFPPTPPPASPPPTTTTKAPAAAPAVVLQPHDLPNLSAPAPNVVPARHVLRLLRGGPVASPAPSPPPTALSPAPVHNTTEEPPSLAPLAFRSPVAAATTNTATFTATAPLPKSPIPVAVAARASPVPGPGRSRPAVVDEDDEADDEEEEKEEDDDGRAVVTRSPLPEASRPVQQRQQQPPQRSLKELVHKRHEKQRASGAISPLVDLEEMETEGGGKEWEGICALILRGNGGII